MADNQKFVQTQPFTMAGAGPAIGATSILLSSFTQIDGITPLTMADFGNKGYATLEPNSGTQEESITFTGVVQNANGTATLTGVSTVSFVAPYTETPGLAKAHAGGTLLVISNTAAFYNGLASKSDDETVTGIWTFTSPNFPRIDNSANLPTDNAQFATKQYVDGVAVAGAPNATTTTKGIVELATTAETKAGTNTGGTGASLVALPSDIASNIQTATFVYAADAGATDSYAITLAPALTAYTAGQSIYFKANTANTGAASLNVNGLGAKTIKKYANGAISDLENNDILSGNIVHVIYDGTNFQLQTQPATQMTTANAQSANTFFGSTSITAAQANTLIGGPTSDATQLHKHLKNCGQTTRLISAGTGTQNIAHGLGVVPKYMRFYSISSPSYQYETMQCWGVATGISNQMCQLPTDVGSGSQVAIQDNTCVIRLRNANNNGDVVVATISALDATNITLNFTTNTGTQTTTFIQWEAES